MKKYYIHEDLNDKIPVLFEGTTEKFKKFIADNEHLIGKDCTKAEYDNAKDKQSIGDHSTRKYILALMEQALQDRTDGKTMVESLDKAIDKYEQIKNKDN